MQQHFRSPVLTICCSCVCGWAEGDIWKGCIRAEYLSESVYFHHSRMVCYEFNEINYKKTRQIIPEIENNKIKSLWAKLQQSLFSPSHKHSVRNWGHAEQWDEMLPQCRRALGTWPTLFGLQFNNVRVWRYDTFFVASRGCQCEEDAVSRHFQSLWLKS